MTTNKNVERYLWISAVMFVTYLLLSSFIVSENYLELGYLVVLYIFFSICLLLLSSLRRLPRQELRLREPARNIQKLKPRNKCQADC